MGVLFNVYRFVDSARPNEKGCRLHFLSFDSKRRVCDTADMSETLTIRVAAEEKAKWEAAAEAAKETVAEYVRGAVRQRAQAANQSPWQRHLGSADVAVPAPTNANIRRSFARRRRVRE